MSTPPNTNLKRKQYKLTNKRKLKTQKAISHLLTVETPMKAASVYIKIDQKLVKMSPLLKQFQLFMLKNILEKIKLHKNKIRDL